MTRPVFISYASDDTPSAASIRDGLEAAGITCWIAPRDIAPGADYAEQIIDAIEACAAMVLVLSETSNQSRYVRNEVERAVAKNKVVIPVRIHNVAPSRSLEFFVSNAQWIDGWDVPLEKVIGVLATAVRKHMPAAAANPATAAPPGPVGSAGPLTRPSGLVSEAGMLGRQAEGAELRKLLLAPGTRLVTVLGPGGIGKSTLASSVAAGLRAAFADGVFEVALAALTRGDEIFAAVANAMSLKTASQLPAAPQLIAHLADKRTLLLLDNVEQLADGAEHIKALLDGAPELRILSTSRERLNLRDEILFRLEGLALPSGDADASKDATNDSVKLFLRYAQRVDPDLVLDGRAYAEIARICRLVNGMPLAIVLAASSADALSLQEIGDEIGSGPDVLETEMHDVPSRQRSMRTVLDSTWARLSPVEQRAFARMSLFRGGFSREAAVAVSGANVRTLVSLHGKSLVRNDSGRYSVHELLRQFGEAKLAASDDAQPAQAGFAAHYLSWLKAREPALQAKDMPVVGEVEADFENVRVAWGLAVEAGLTQLIDGGLDALMRFCHLRGRVRDGCALLTRALDVMPDGPWQTRLLEQRAFAYEIMGEYGHEIADATIALGFARARGDEHRVIWLLNRQGYAHSRLAQFGPGQAVLAEALAICQRLGDPHAEADTLSHIGRIFLHLDDRTRALTTLERALAIVEREKFHDLVTVQVTYGMAAVYNDVYNWDKAISYFQKSLELAREIGDSPYEIMSLAGLGIAIGTGGRLRESNSVLEEAIAVAERAQTPHVAFWALWSLGGQKALLGDYADGLKHAARCLHWARLHGSLPMETNAHGMTGPIYSELKMFELARGELEHSLKLMDSSGFALGGRHWVKTMLALVGMRLDKHDAQWLSRLAQVRSENELAGKRNALALALNALCEYHYTQGDINTVIDLSREALRVAPNPQVGSYIRSQIWLGTAQAAVGQPAEGLALLNEALARAQAIGYHRVQIDAHRALQRAHANAGQTDASDRHRVAAEGLIQQIRVNLKDRPDLLGGLHLL